MATDRHDAADARYRVFIDDAPVTDSALTTDAAAQLVKDARDAYPQARVDIRDAITQRLPGSHPVEAPRPRATRRRPNLTVSLHDVTEAVTS